MLQNTGANILQLDFAKKRRNRWGPTCPEMGIRNALSRLMASNNHSRVTAFCFERHHATIFSPVLLYTAHWYGSFRRYAGSVRKVEKSETPYKVFSIEGRETSQIEDGKGPAEKKKKYLICQLGRWGHDPGEKVGKRVRNNKRASKVANGRPRTGEFI